MLNETRNLWLAFADVPTDYVIIEENFFKWKSGTNIDEILEWFDNNYPGGVVELQKLLPEDKKFDWEVPMWYVDLPNINTLNTNSDGEIEYMFENIAVFNSKDEALKFAQEKLGADEEGKICLISGG